MIRKRVVISQIFSLALLTIGLSTSSALWADSYKIGFISSGAQEAVRVQKLIIKELTPFIGESDGIEFDTFIADPTLQSFQAQSERAYSDPGLDAIIAPGFIGSQYIYKQTVFSKPTFLSWVINPALVASDVKLSTPNLFWNSTRGQIDTTFKTIARLIGKRPVSLLIESATANLGQSFFDGLKKNAQKYNLDFSVTLIDRTKPIIRQITQPIALALVPPMQRSTADIIRSLQANNIPVFTFEGPKAVEEGAMMTDVVDANESLIARSIALDIYGLLQGEKLEPGPRWLESEHHLTINLAAANKMGVDLPIDVLSSATLVGFENRNVRSISLDNALQWVLDKNPDLAVSSNNVALADESIAQAKSALLPQFNGALSHTRNSENGLAVNSGNPDQNTLASINFSQELYSIVDRTNHKVSKLNKIGQQYLDQANRQIAVVSTLTSFLQVLISEANLTAQQENIQLARSNLSMAQKRSNLGSGTAGDVYNSEALIASANSNLLASRIGALEARRALMDLSSTEFDENSVFEDIGLKHPSVAASHQLVQPLLESLSGIQKLASWSANQIVEASPSLQAFNVAIDSNKMLLKAADKGRYTPEVRLSGQAFEYLDSSRGSSGENLQDVDDMSLSVNVTLPLWTSGRLTSLIRQTNKQLINSELEYRSNKNSAQVAAKNAVYSLAQAWQDIKLGKIALSSAEKSLDINQRAYASGAITIDALQSIQNTYISALSADKTNLYQYIQTLANWQLQVSAVTYLMDDNTLEQWSTAFQAHYLTQ